MKKERNWLDLWGTRMPYTNELCLIQALDRSEDIMWLINAKSPEGGEAIPVTKQETLDDIDGAITSAMEAFSACKYLDQKKANSVEARGRILVHEVVDLMIDWIQE